MTLPMVTCPLCCRPGFSSSDSLCTALVDVTTRKLSCPICNFEVSGLDKFTIHLFSHSLNRYLKTKDSCQTNDIVSNKSCSNIQGYNTAVASEVQNNVNNDKLQNNIDEETSKPGEKQESWVSNNFSVKCAKHIPGDTSLIYLRSDNGQILAINHENIGSNLKNVTINTQNYITSTNITTSTLQTNLIGNVQKRKYCEVFDKDRPYISSKCLDTECTPEINGDSWPSVPSVSSEAEKFGNCNKHEREFESCKDLLTKGDFSTNCDDVSDLEPENNLESKNYDEQKVENKDSENKSKESTTCELCSYVFPNKTILAMHIQLIHKKVENEIENKRKLLFCSQCPRTFSLRSSLMIHRRVAHAGGFGNNDNATSSKQLTQNFSCQVCGKFFNKDIHLSQHMKVHDEKQWQCSICAKGFTTKYFLKKHRRLHTGEMPYRCKTCSKSFTFQQTYRKHLLYHNNDKPYCCAQCGRLFKELSTLHNHERIHSGEKPFTCETCGKAFRQRVSYLVHRRIHTGVMPYKCTACNKSFRYKISQRTHKCTSQPPGVVVRTQGYLVHRLQAALNKAAESNDNKCSDIDANVQDLNTVDSSSSAGDINATFEKAHSLLSGDKTCTSSGRELRDMSSVEDKKSDKNLIVSKIKHDKPQIYLLVKGPNGETFYQPLLLSPNFVTTTVQQSNDVTKNDALVSKYPKILTEVNPGIKIEHIDFPGTSQNKNSSKLETKNMVEISSLLDIKASMKGKVVSKNCRDKDTAIVELKKEESKNVNKQSQINNSEETPCTQEANNSNINGDSVNDSSIMSDLFDSLVYISSSDNQIGEISNETKESINNSNKNNKADSNSDTIIDSSDLFSLMLSPTLSSPSDKFGRLSLSPNTSLQADNYESTSLVTNSSLNNLTDVPQDPFFETITDDTLKELLFGGVK